MLKILRYAQILLFLLMGHCNYQLMFYSVLLIFSTIIINGAEQKSIDCNNNFFNTTLVCKNINHQPVIMWSFEMKFKIIIRSRIQHLILTMIGVESFMTEIFFKFTNVETIDLSRNKLRRIDFNEFKKNSKLESLNLGSNQITDIEPIQTSTINIINLKINDNDLTNISELCKITKLKELNLSRNRRLDFNKVAFNCWNDLTKLNLAETNLKSLNHDYHHVLNSCKKLKFVNLMDNNLETICFEHFPDLPLLEHLNIRNNSLTNLDAAKLKEKFPSLKNITVSGNKWSCDYYKNNLKPQLTTFKILKINEDELCLNISVIPKEIDAPKAEHNLNGSSVMFWIILILDCFLLINFLALLICYIYYR
jgi:Leucine-rich repeat (LRR) protein